VTLHEKNYINFENKKLLFHLFRDPLAELWIWNLY